MATYALISNNRIVNVVEWDGETEYQPAADEVVSISKLPAGVWIGWTRGAKGKWSAPPPLPSE